MTTKYVDTKAIIQVIGSIYQEPSLIDNENYNFNEDDFPTDFHKVMFGCIYNLHALGAKNITVNTIEDYLGQRPTKEAIYKTYNGRQWLEDVSKTVTIATFDYYYKRMKKFTLLRMYESVGVDVSYLYDVDNILDLKKKQKQEEWLDNTDINEIAVKINDKIEEIKSKYVDNMFEDIVAAGAGQRDLFQHLQDEPCVGYPMFGDIYNSIFRGARLGCVYLRSAPTNYGKTRMLIADACTFACSELYDSKTKQWKKNGTVEPTLYISTEQEIKEAQTMMWAFIADVPEDHVLEKKCTQEETERIEKAMDIIENSPLYFKALPDFSLTDVENLIKRGINKYGIRYICFDYIHSSIKILSEISSRAQVKGLREDNVLFMMSVKIKDIAVQYGVFIITSTQLNGDYVNDKIFDQNLLRGAKAIADKVDVGMIILPVTDQDRESIRGLCEKNGFEIPRAKISVYKNRGGKYNHLFLWCETNLGTCKITPIFATDYLYTPIEIEELVIEVEEREEEQND